jgi:hypothetical protein
LIIPEPTPAQTCDSWHKEAHATKKTHRSSQDEYKAAHRRRTAGRLGFDESKDETFFTKIVNLTRKTLFSDISGFKEALSRRKCVVRLPLRSSHAGARREF